MPFFRFSDSFRFSQWVLFFVMSAFLSVALGCENPDPTAPMPLPDERPMPEWGTDFGKTAQASLDPTALSAPASVGQSLFQNHCASCHGGDASGTLMGPQINGPKTLSKTDALLSSTIMAGKAGMPSFKGRLSDPQISEILVWLRTQKKGVEQKKQKASPTKKTDKPANAKAAATSTGEKKSATPAQ